MSVNLQMVQDISNETGYNLLVCKDMLEGADNNKTLCIERLKELQGEASKPETNADLQVHGEIYSYYDIARNCAILLKVETPSKDLLKNPDFMDLVDATMFDISECEQVIEANTSKSIADNNFRSSIEFDFKRMIKKDPAAEILTTYVHEGRIGSIVGLAVTKGDPSVLSNFKVKQFAFDLAMHVVAFSPYSIKISPLPNHIKHPLILGMETELATSAKPLAIWDTIIDGKLKKISEQNCFYSQIFIKSNTLTVSEALVSLEKELDVEFAITQFARLEV